MLVGTNLFMFMPIWPLTPVCWKPPRLGELSRTIIDDRQSEDYRAAVRHVLRAEGLYFYRDTGNVIRYSTSAFLMAEFTDRDTLFLIQPKAIGALLRERHLFYDRIYVRPDWVLPLKLKIDAGAWETGCWLVRPLATGIPPADWGKHGYTGK